MRRRWPGLRWFHAELLACPACGNTRLIIYPFKEKEAGLPGSPEKVKCRRWCYLYDRPAATVPLKSCVSTCMYREVEEGVIVCPVCGRWYPITEGIVVMLDDKYRDDKKYLEFIEKYRDRLPEWVARHMKIPPLTGAQAQGGGSQQAPGGPGEGR